MGAIRHINERPEMPKCLIMADLGFKLAKEMFIYLESKNIKVFTSDRESKSKNISITDFLNNQFVEFQVLYHKIFNYILHNYKISIFISILVGYIKFIFK